jgi:hypothetical protein
VLEEGTAGWFHGWSRRATVRRLGELQRMARSVDSDDGARGRSHVASPAPTGDLPRRSSDEVWRGRAEANAEFSSRRSHDVKR